MTAPFMDRSDWQVPEHRFIKPQVWRRADVDREVTRLLEMPQSVARRSVRVVHPETGPEHGISPGIGVVISVLSPGEADRAHRHTFSVVNFIRDGHGHSIIDGQRLEWGPGDVFVTPGWSLHHHEAAPDSPPVVRLSFTDAPLHEKLGVSIYDEPGESDVAPPQLSGSNIGEPQVAPEGIPLGEDGAQLLTYQHMLSPKITANVPMLWRWNDIKPHLDAMDNGDPEFNGRRVVMLYHPATGIAQGTTSTLTAFQGIIVAGETHQPHRHTSVAINYWYEGSGHSLIGGEHVRWEAGDFSISPAWAVHAHANDGDSTAWGLTIHDAPLLFHTGALLWQEALDEDAAVLGRTGDLTPASTGGSRD